MTDLIKEIHIFRDREHMADFAIDQWTEISEAAIKNNGYFSAALSGGKTPVPFYKKLAEKKLLPWDKTHVFIVDERFVPYESDENNYHMIYRTLLRHVNIPEWNIHPVRTSGVSPESSAEEYEKDIQSYCKKVHTRKPQFDLIVLGIGEDGHTASLFPESPALKEMGRFAVSVAPADKQKKERITLTFPAINNAGNVMFLVSGANKAEITKAVIEKKTRLLPAAMVTPKKGRLMFILDESAGSLLSGSTQSK